ncbi:hypothetical protein dsx2_1339 [Desulfovibrio sp. X2]|uniref:hypothetical protein n=1 Tax=Desulfovibrio sp. X2 TaxID=941449 RepID=UPI000358BB79|nr:hypothetical protein [Desulfovibrio sp. X2]EPR44711.1 hypothetical protein dsx2_1339 [Desulfovibrio sp. X2]
MTSCHDTPGTILHPDDRADARADDFAPRADAFVRHLTAVLDDSLESMSGGTRSRLTRARYRAMERAAKGRLLSGHFLSGRRLFTGGALAAATAAAFFFLVPGPVELPHQANHPLEVELAAAPDSLDLYENLEFYTWLAAENPSRT